MSRDRSAMRTFPDTEEGRVHALINPLLVKRIPPFSLAGQMKRPSHGGRLRASLWLRALKHQPPGLLLRFNLGKSRHPPARTPSPPRHRTPLPRHGRTCCPERTPSAASQSDSDIFVRSAAFCRLNIDTEADICGLFILSATLKGYRRNIAVRTAERGARPLPPSLESSCVSSVSRERWPSMHIISTVSQAFPPFQEGGPRLRMSSLCCPQALEVTDT
ncbi:hypothetical protein AAFF_G00319840 [Aldrovandia affinis]|uniref:Uncharacterized protein n=1 Tax=Aldrovandia affinis TaxID=143900 RepID=A0AAD7SMV6_9TELE|nr:hypothetical protein AAFF_G00319840 [Aldrovandia affinis]